VSWFAFPFSFVCFSAGFVGLATFQNNLYNGALKGNLFFSRFATDFNGTVHTAPVSTDGELGDVTVFRSYSGLSIAVTPYGSLYMPQVRKGKVVVLAAQYETAGRGTMVLSVTPNRGPKAGGYRVYVAGHNFAASPTVTVGGKPCTDVKLDGNVGLTCTMPEGAGKVAAVVDGASSSGHDFEYLDV